MVAAVGAADQLVGVSHECDWPSAVATLPRVTTTPIDPHRSAAEIHHAVQAAVAAGRSVIGIDAAVLRQLHPDLIITQDLCDVCAVADGEAHRLAAVLDPAPEVIVLCGTTLPGVWEDIRTVGRVTGHEMEGELVAQELEMQVATAIGRSGDRRPRVIAIEWLDPLFLAGHWVPEMIWAAGGRDVGADAGSHSVIRAWDDVMALDPELIFVILCGFDEARARQELARLAHPDARRWLDQRLVVILDGNAYTSRPGPRLLDGIHQMARAIAALDFPSS